MKAYDYFLFSIGFLTIAETDQHISSILFGQMTDLEASGFQRARTPYLLEAAEQLEEYFQGRRKIFSLKVRPTGTDFQQRVWQALLTIPYGETKSYQEIAMLVGNAKAARAIGMANNKNPISILIPCHRVIGKNGSLVGYGAGLQNKEFLLQLEKEYA